MATYNQKWENMTKSCREGTCLYSSYRFAFKRLSFSYIKRIYYISGAEILERAGSSEIRE